MKKITMCGPRLFNEESEGRKVYPLSSAIGKLSKQGLIYLATGGSIGIPLRILQDARNYNPQLITEAITPCKDEEEWDFYVKTGLAPSRDYFNRITYSRAIGDITRRAIERIPTLVGDSYANLFYVNKNAGNTNTELGVSLGLERPTIVLASTEEIKSAINSLWGRKKGLKVTTNPAEIVSELERLVI